MPDRDDGPIDKLKRALGMGDRAGEERGEGRADDARAGHGRYESDQTGEGAEPQRVDDNAGAHGATQASGVTGATGGTGSTAAMGGAGAGGAIGATPSTSETDEPAPAGGVRTEYEMGHEVDPDHETRAESGVSRGGTFGESPPGAQEDSDRDAS